MGQKSDVVFVFTRDGDVEVFDGIDAAEGWIEAIDVLDGEYSELFRIDGERLTLTAIDNVSPVVVQGTGEFEPGQLAERLSSVAERNGFDGTDPVAIANQALAFRWKTRWPRWPRWLDRRMNGDGPPSV